MKKKTVVLHPLVDRYVRHTQAVLLESEPEIEATYSTAVNFMLIGLISQAGEPEGVSAAARDNMWDFTRDIKTVERINLQERLHRVREDLGRLEEGGPPRRNKR